MIISQSVCQVCNSKLIEKEYHKARYHCYNIPNHYEASFGGKSIDEFPITSYISNFTKYQQSWANLFGDLYIYTQKDRNQFKVFRKWKLDVFLKSDEEIENYILLC